MDGIAKGTFDVKLTALSDGEAGVKSGIDRRTIDKRFQGDLQGSSIGQMLSVGTEVKGSAGYVALERVTGVLAGRNGSFALQHSGTMARGIPKLEISVVPDSGTGELVGLRGRMAIEITNGQHSYHFEYSIRISEVG